MALHEYQYEITEGPGELDIIFSIMRGQPVYLSVRKLFDDRSREYWEAVINQISKDDSMKIGGSLRATGGSRATLSARISKCTFTAAYDAKTRTGTVTVTVHLP
jgi:hypothetical protein